MSDPTRLAATCRGCGHAVHEPGRCDVIVGTHRRSVRCRCESERSESDRSAASDRLGVTLTVYGLPQPAGSKVAGRSKAGKLFVRDAAKGSAPWKRQVAQAAGEAMDGAALLDGPLELVAEFYLPRPQAHFGARGLRPSAPAYPTKRPDTTKLLRAVEDALTGIVWRDDAQVVEQIAAKLFGEPARCELRVRALSA